MIRRLYIYIYIYKRSVYVQRFKVLRASSRNKMIAEIKLAVWEDGPLAFYIIFRKLSVTFRAGSMLRFFFFPPAAIDGYYYEFCFLSRFR